MNYTVDTGDGRTMLTAWDHKPYYDLTQTVEVQVMVNMFVDRRGSARYSLVVKSDRPVGEAF